MTSMTDKSNPFARLVQVSELLSEQAHVIAEEQGFSDREVVCAVTMTALAWAKQGDISRADYLELHTMLVLLTWGNQESPTP